MKSTHTIVAAALAFLPLSCFAKEADQSRKTTQLRPVVVSDVVTVVFKEGLPPAEKSMPQRVKVKETRMAVEVVGVRKNGWLELHGRRETFANGKVMRLDVKAVVRPESIDSKTRTVSSDEIAELRIATHIAVPNTIEHSNQSR